MQIEKGGHSGFPEESVPEESTFTTLSSVVTMYYTAK